MDLSINPHRQTGPLPQHKVPATIAAVETTPSVQAASGPTDRVGRAPAQGDSLTSVSLFAEAPASAGIDAGTLALQDLHNRRASGNQGEHRSMDFALARLTQQISALPVSELEQALGQLYQHLPGMGNSQAVPLSAEAIEALNARLKPFGLKTDGQQLFDLSVRVVGQDKPIAVTRSDLNRLRNACTAALSHFAQHPTDRFGSPVVSPAADPAVARFSVPTPQTPDLSTGLTSPGQLDALLQPTSYDSMLGVDLSFLDDNAASISANTGPAAIANTRVAEANRKTEKLRVEVQMEGRRLANMQQTAAQLLSQPRIAPSAAELPEINQQLAASGLEIRLDAQGQPGFFQQGQQISEADFRVRLHTACDSKIEEVAQLNHQLADSVQNLNTLLTANDELFSTLGADLAKGNAAMERLQGYRQQIGQDLNRLLSLQQHSASWNQLTPAQQSAAEARIAVLRKYLNQIETALSHARPIYARAGQEIERSRDLRERAARLIERAQQTLDQMNKLLAQAKTGMEQLEAPAAAVATPVETLHQQADELETQLNLAPQPDAAKLGKLAEKWLQDLEASFAKISQLHQADAQKAVSARRSLERNAAELREKLNYHEKKLDELSTQNRERIHQALEQSLIQVRALTAD